MKTEIRHNWLYSQSASEIWEYLTNSDLIEKWLMPNTFKLEVGHEFTFNTNPIPPLGLNGIFYCKVLEIIPEEKLVYSWKGGLSESNPTLETVVEWSLKARENGTELTLVHSGFKDGNISILNGMTEGWNGHIEKMLSNLNTNENVSTKS